MCYCCLMCWFVWIWVLIMWFACYCCSICCFTYICSNCWLWCYICANLLWNVDLLVINVDFAVKWWWFVVWFLFSLHFTFLLKMWCLLCYLSRFVCWNLYCFLTKCTVLSALRDYCCCSCHVSCLGRASPACMHRDRLLVSRVSPGTSSLRDTTDEQPVSVCGGGKPPSGTTPRSLRSTS